MRRELVVFAVILAAVLVFGLFLRSLAPHIAIGQLKSAFPGYEVSIGSAEFRNAGMIAVTAIDLKKGGTNRYRIKSVEINFSPLSLVTKIIPRIAVKGASVEIISPDKNLADLIEYPVPRPGKSFLVKSVQFSDLVVNLETADWRLNTVADGDIAVGKEIAYHVQIRLDRIDLAFLVKALNADEKVGLNGIMAGSLSLSGKNLKIAEIKGDFSTSPPGGKLVIKDEDFLKRLAENTKQPLEIIKEGFKNYDFTKGTLWVSRDPESILLHIILDGAKGKRDMTVALHGY